jgi:phosphoserine phosphatase
MKYKAVVFDMDGVLIDERSSWTKVHKNFDTDCSTNFKAFEQGDITYSEFMRRDIGEWIKKRKVTYEDILKIFGKFEPMTGAKEVVDQLRKQGYVLCIVSCGIGVLAKNVAEYFGIEHVYANGLVIDEFGYLTGEGIKRVPLWEKHETLKQFCTEHNILPSEVIAIADTKFDSQIIKAAGLGIAFNPGDEDIRKAADVVVEGQDLKDVLPYIFNE